jgi:hypothetical protein
MMDFAISVPTADQLADSHKTYGVDKNYVDSVHAISQELQNKNLSAVVEAVAAFLKYWNRTYYRFHPKKRPLLDSELEELVTGNLRAIMGLHERSITSLVPSDQEAVVRVFSAFESKLGPVGSAKALNLLAPSFLPLWDNPIAYAYGLTPGRVGYLLFMLICKYQVEKCNGPFPVDVLPLKAMDEYNYCKYTEPFLASRRTATKPGKKQSVTGPDHA